MSLDLFLHQLHFDIDRTKPPDLEVDWEDGPLAYKLYQGVPAVGLSSEIPLTLDSLSSTAIPDLQAISHLMWYVFGLTQWSQSIFASMTAEPSISVLQMHRRFAPSGGALYPNECYLYLKIEDVPAGIYHYDAAHHRLMLLREGRFDSYLTRSLGSRCDLSACFGVVFVSAMFWKNFFKYNDFSYRLQGLDAGVLIGQLLETAKRFGYASGVVFRFLDRAVNHLLGLSEQEESVYAVIPLSLEPAACWFGQQNQEGDTTAARLIREIEPLHHKHYVRSRRIKAFPRLIQMNVASMTESLPPLTLQSEGEKTAACEEQIVTLPCVQRLSYDFAAVCKKRYSLDRDFIISKVSQIRFAELLQETTAAFGYINDLDGIERTSAPRVSLYVCVHNVSNIPDGAYRYDSATQTLRMIRPGDYRSWLQLGMSADNVNLFQVPLCFHVAGNKDHHIPKLGYRGYRIQQMEAGMLVQRLLLSASAIGMGGHPLLGYDARLSDEIYLMPQRGMTSLIQIPIGEYRPGPRLTWGLHS